MSATTEEAASAATPALAINIAPAVARAYLVNVAETLNNVVIPQLEGHARARAFECLRIVSRLATDMAPSEATRALLAADDGEATAFENVNAEGMAFLKSVMAAPPAAVRTFDRPALEAYLRQHPSGGDQLRLTEARLLAGGRSKITILVSQQGARALPTDFVVRQDWAESLTGKSVVAEFALLDVLYRHGIRVPQPLLLEESVEVIGSPFIAMARLPGAPAGDGFQALPASMGPVLQMAEQLGRLHAIPREAFAGIGEIVEADCTPDQVRHSLKIYADVFEKLDNPKSPLLSRTIDWLYAHAGRVADSPLALVHGDVGFHNSLIDGDDLAAILDWEMAHIGHPAKDLGYLRNAVIDDAMWAEFLRRYETAGGQRVDPFLVDYFTLFTCIWFHHIQLRARTALCTGVVHDIEIAAVCAHIAPQSLACIARTLRRVAGK